MTDKLVGLPDEVVLNKIYLIRDQKVMLDSDLAELYGMFEMSPKEYEALRCQFGTSNQGRGGLRYMPFCFTEQDTYLNKFIDKADSPKEQIGFKVLKNSKTKQ